MAAADGNAPALTMLLALFERTEWQVHFGPLFSEPRRGGKRDRYRDRTHDALPSLSRPSAGLSRRSAGRKDHGGDSGKEEAQWGELPSLGRRSVSRWAGAAASTLSDFRSLLAHALPAAAGGGGGAARGSASAPALGGGMHLERGSATASPAGTTDTPPDARGSPVATPSRLLSPCVSQKSRAAAVLDTLQEVHTLEEAGTPQGFAFSAAAAAAVAVAAAEGDLDPPPQLAAAPQPRRAARGDASAAAAGGAAGGFVGERAGEEAGPAADQEAAGVIGDGGDGSCGSHGNSFGASSQDAAKTAASAVHEADTPPSSSPPPPHRLSAPGSAGPLPAGFAPADTMPHVPPQPGRRSLLRDLSRRRLGLLGWGLDRGGGSGGSGDASSGCGGTQTSSEPRSPPLGHMAGVSLLPDDDSQHYDGPPLAEVTVRGPSPLAPFAGESACRHSSNTGEGGRRASGGVSSTLHRGVRALLRFGSASLQPGDAEAPAAAAWPPLKGRSEGGCGSEGGGRDHYGLHGTSRTLLHMSTVGHRPAPEITLMGPGAASGNSLSLSAAAACAGSEAAAPSPPRHGKHGAPPEDLLRLAMGSQQAQAVRVVVDGLVAGRFSRASVMVHLYDALQVLLHDPQHRRLCRRLLKHLPMVVSSPRAPARSRQLGPAPVVGRAKCRSLVPRRSTETHTLPSPLKPHNCYHLQDTGEVEVDSSLTRHSRAIYKCSNVRREGAVQQAGVETDHGNRPPPKWRAPGAAPVEPATPATRLPRPCPRFPRSTATPRGCGPP
jgi:hypothetical protein